MPETPSETPPPASAPKAGAERKPAPTDASGALIGFKPRPARSPHDAEALRKYMADWRRRMREEG